MGVCGGCAPAAATAPGAFPPAPGCPGSMIGIKMLASQGLDHEFTPDWCPTRAPPSSADDGNRPRWVPYVSHPIPEIRGKKAKKIAAAIVTEERNQQRN